jgi:hypothetical protein
MELSRQRPLESHGLLYPMMVIAAIAVIVFSIVGILTIMGWMPSAMASTDATSGYGNRARITFECAECGVIESIRDIERRDDRGHRRGDAVAAILP